MSRGSHLEKLNEWTDRLKRFAKSQQTVSVFCRNEGVSEPSFYHWKKKLLDLRIPSDSRSRSRFRAVGVSTSVSHAPSTHDWERSRRRQKSGWLSPIEIKEASDPVGADLHPNRRRASQKGFLPMSLAK